MSAPGKLPQVLAEPLPAPQPQAEVPVAGAGPALPTCILSVDVEDYFHATGLAADPGTWDELPGRVEYNTRRLLQLFAEHGVRATFFVLGWVARRYPGLVREIAGADHEIASHGWGHQLVSELGPARFRQDVVRTKGMLEDLTGKRVLGYRAPSFSLARNDTRALRTLAQAGYAYDSSIFPVRRARYGDPDAPRHPYRLLAASIEHAGLVEVPPSTIRVLGRNVPVAGGGYFRAYPLWVTLRAIDIIRRREGQPAVVYVHPWEIDPDQPRIATAPLDAWRHYLNLHRTEKRLRALLERIPFARMADVLGLEQAMAPAGSQHGSRSIRPHVA